MSVTNALGIDHAEWVGRAASLKPRTDLYIDGGFRPAESGERFPTVSPRNGSVLAEVAAGGEPDIDRAVRSARKVFDAGTWSEADPSSRRKVLLRFADLIDEHTAELALLESLDVGKPIADTTRVDAPGAARCIRWYAETIDKTYDEIAPSPRNALALITRERG